jgi:phosphatidylglycerol:prolipoprotein diacylglycerol transferase
MYPRIHIGPLEIPTFGLLVVAGVALGIWLAGRRASQYGITKTQVSDAAVWAVIAGILGARLVFIALEWDHYSQNLNELMTLRFQGLTSFGGLGFGALAVILWCRRSGVPVLQFLDLAAPSFIVGHILGRVGCLLNGCCFGGACPPDLPWAISVAGSPVPHHPAQIYDSLMNVVVLGVLLWLESRKVLRSGQLMAIMIALHGVARFIYEFWRAGTPEQVRSNLASSTYLPGLPITEAQAFALLMVAMGVAMVVWFGRNRALPQVATA